MENNIHNKLHRDYFGENLDTEIYNRLSNYKVPESRHKKEIFDNLLQKIELGQKSTMKMPTNYRPFIFSIAASLVVLMGLYFLFNLFDQQKIVAGVGKQIQYQLPDGSVVYLNACSEIKFSKFSFVKNRQLKLVGEAFFDVRKGSKFLIETPKAKVQILGTTLNVFSRDEGFKVTCHTGRVQVTSNSQTEIIIPGESVEMNNNQLEKTTEKNIEKTSTWRTGIFYFDNKSLMTIFDEVERQFDVSIEAPAGLENRFFTGSFSNKNLIETLDIVCIPMDLNYEIRPGHKVIITHKNDR